MKAFVIGFPKSGTSTLQTALTRSGWKSAHWYSGELGLYVGKAMYKRLYEGVDPFLDFSGFDAIAQADLAAVNEAYWPQLDPIMMGAVLRYHPDCLLILNYRDARKTASSICRWREIQGLNLQERLDRNGAPGLPKGYAKNAENIARWIELQHETLRLTYGNHPNFFEFDIDDPEAPKHLGDRLGIEIKWWGHANKNDGPSSRKDRNEPS